jgi:hypothetical protein
MNQQLFATLLPFLISGGIQLVEDIIATVKGDPKSSTEDEATYVARIKAKIESIGHQILSEDAAAAAGDPASV